jgi:hypothetical protein
MAVLGRTLKRRPSEGVARILPPAAALPAYPDGGGFVLPVELLVA